MMNGKWRMMNGEWQVANGMELNCPICKKRTFKPFFELNDVPVQDGLLWDSQEEALKSPLGDIKLAFCRSCGYVGNRSFEPEKIKYDQTYSFSLHFSPTYQEFIDQLAARLVETYQLRDKTILEIGCGRGDFLRSLCKLGHNKGLGIDPAASQRANEQNSPLWGVRGASQRISEITFVQDFYSEKYADQESDFICCRHVLDQLPDPKTFVELVRQNIGSRSKTVVYFEAPNAVNIFQDLLIRNIIYEKSSWFTAYSISRLFELSGFEVLAVEPCYEAGQYLGIEVIPQGDVPVPTASQRVSGRRSKAGGQGDNLDYFSQLVVAFAENYERKTKTWRNQLAAMQQAGQRAIAWGAGSGAISFFNTLKINEQIPFVVDINPNRQGKFLPLTGQQVVPPEFIQAFQPDLIVITNPTYEKEIREQVASLGVTCSYWSI